MTDCGLLTLVSNYFGAMECPDSSLFHFAAGLPGFECERHFAPVEIPEQWPLVYLQSINRPDLCLITLPVRTICPEFDLELLPEDTEALGFPAGATPRNGEDVLCLAIIAVDERREPTANLLAPLVVNMRTREAVQAIQPNSLWTCDQPLGQPVSC